MKRKITKRGRTVELAMLKAGTAFLGDEQSDNLRCVIRITSEFYEYLQRNRRRSRNEDRLGYVLETIFSGIDSFLLVSGAYRVMVGARNSRIEWQRTPVLGLDKQFLDLFRECVSERDPAEICRLLLDLFKLQIVFAGAFYE